MVEEWTLQNGENRRKSIFGVFGHFRVFGILSPIEGSKPIFDPKNRLGASFLA